MFVSGLFVLFCFRIVCEDVCICVCVRACVCVCVAVNSHASYRYIVNDIDCNSFFFFLFQCLSFCFGLVCVRWSVYVCVLTL